MVRIKELKQSDYPILKEFIYWSIFTPPGFSLPDRSVVSHPSISIYIDGFGQESDCGVFAEADGKVIGAAWARIIHAFGHVDDSTPELAISLLPQYRNQGIGTRLMERLFELLSQKGYAKTSLAVQKENPAVSFYLRLGYEIVGEKPEEYLMVKKL